MHRGYLQRIPYSIMFRCRQCGYRIGNFHSWMFAFYRFVFSRYTRCIHCGTDSVSRSSKRDRIDRPVRHPLSVLFQVLGAPLNRCAACRLQYYDWRRPHRDVE
jgi:hypothetical protein